MGSTALSAAFERKGITPHVAEFRVALAKFRNNGGTYESGLEELRAAYGLSGEASDDVSKDQKAPASTRQQNGDEEGQSPSADKARSPVPSSSPTERDGAGQTFAAHDGHLAAARSVSDITPTVAARVLRSVQVQRMNTARLVREPTELQRKVMAHVAKVVASVSLETYRVRDGRLLFKVKRGELRSLAATNRNEAMLLEMLRLHLDREHPGGDMLAEVGDLIDPSDAKRLFEKSKEIADAA